MNPFMLKRNQNSASAEEFRVGLALKVLEITRESQEDLRRVATAIILNALNSGVAQDFATPVQSPQSDSGPVEILEISYVQCPACKAAMQRPATGKTTACICGKTFAVQTR